MSNRNSENYHYMSLADRMVQWGEEEGISPSTGVNKGLETPSQTNIDDLQKYYPEVKITAQNYYTLLAPILRGEKVG